MRTHTTTPTDAHRRARRVWAAGKMLRWHSLQLSSILAALDRSADGLLSREEFVCGLVRTLGFTGDRAVLETTYDTQVAAIWSPSDHHFTICEHHLIPI